MIFSQLLAPDTFEFFARYLLAGYVVIFVRSAFVLGLRPKLAETLIEAIILSLIVQLLLVVVEAVLGLLIVLEWLKIDFPTWVIAPPDTLKLAFRVLIVPALVGCMLGLFLQSGWRNGVLRRLSLPVVHPVRRAHDFAFGYNRQPCLVEVTFEDGTKVAGWFGENSLASTDDARSDLYLERAYLIDDKGDWTEPKEPRAILVSLRNARSIEFLLSKDEKDDDTQNDVG